MVHAMEQKIVHDYRCKYQQSRWGEREREREGRAEAAANECKAGCGEALLFAVGQ